MADNQDNQNEDLTVHTYQDDLDTKKQDEVTEEASEKTNPYLPENGAPEPMNRPGTDDTAHNNNPADDDAREYVEDKDEENQENKET